MSCNPLVKHGSMSEDMVSPFNSSYGTHVADYGFSTTVNHKRKQLNFLIPLSTLPCGVLPAHQLMKIQTNYQRVLRSNPKCFKLFYITVMVLIVIYNLNDHFQRKTITR